MACALIGTPPCYWLGSERDRERRGQPPDPRLLRPCVRMQIAGRGLEVGVAEGFPHGADIDTAADEVDGELRT